MRAIPQKIKILKFVGEQGIVTLSDVTRHLSKPEKFDSVRMTMHQLGISQMRYRHEKHGIWFIENPKLYELLSSYYPGYPLLDVEPVFDNHIPHYLELNRIRIALEQTNQITLDEWWSERFIRALPKSLKDGFNWTNCPDAIFWRKLPDGGRQKYFIEYERNLKNRDRYLKIFASYCRRQDVYDSNVIYLCHTSAIRRNLITIEHKLAQTGQLQTEGMHFQFVELESFYQSHHSHIKEAVDEVNQANLQVAVV